MQVGVQMLDGRVFQPPLAVWVSQYMELIKMWTACNRCAGFCISLGKLFFSEGAERVDSEILPEFSAKAAKGISPRVLPSYAILFWFALQVCF